MRYIIKYILFFLFQMGFYQLSCAQDWADLARYRRENERLKTEPNTGDRVVYIGDSITYFWVDSSRAFFEEHHYIDRGIKAQTTPQILIRFRADVINLKPKVVVILCGTNDIAGNTGPSTLEMIEDNITSMAELSKMNRIRIILCSILPATDFQMRPAERIDSLNTWIKKYADKNHIVYLDLYSAFANNKKGMRKEYTTDGLHPNKTGYQLMESFLQPAIEQVLARKKYQNK